MPSWISPGAQVVVAELRRPVAGLSALGLAGGPCCGRSRCPLRDRFRDAAEAPPAFVAAACFCAWAPRADRSSSLDGSARSRACTFDISIAFISRKSSRIGANFASMRVSRDFSASFGGSEEALLCAWRRLSCSHCSAFCASDVCCNSVSRSRQMLL